MEYNKKRTRNFLAKWQVGQPWLQHDHDGIGGGGKLLGEYVLRVTLLNDEFSQNLKVSNPVTVLNLVCNLVCIFSLKGCSSTGQPSVSHGACAASGKPVGATFHNEKEVGIKQDFCQGGNQEQTK